MTEREKLIELFANAIYEETLCTSDGEPVTTLQFRVVKSMNEAEFLADHLLANGVIVPPCKVGDVVYFIQDKKIYEGTVILIRPFIHNEYTTFHGNVQYECEDPFYNDNRMMTHQISVVFQEYGNNTIAYLSREDAEKALEERKEK